MIMSQILFQTDQSSLVLHELENEWVQRMSSICEEIDPLLIHHPELMMYGKVCHMRRSVGFFSNDSIGYRYSGQLAAAQPLQGELLNLLHHINTRFESHYNGILVNKYESGDEYISRHSDDESALDPNVGVLMISVGSIRTFRIRDKTSGAVICNVPTNPQHILQMCGHFQKEFTHEIPVEKRVIGVRYSFTFRHHNE